MPRITLFPTFVFDLKAEFQFEVPDDNVVSPPPPHPHSSVRTPLKSRGPPLG